MFDGPDMFDPAIFDTKGQFTVSLVEPTVTIGDSVATNSQFKRNIVDAGGAMFDPEIFDDAIFDAVLKTIPITDSIVSTRTAFRTIVEAAIPITDDVARKFDAFRVITEPTLAITDSVDRQFSAFRTFIENSPITEDLASRMDAFVALIENVPITDSVTAIRAAFVTLIEPVIAITDSVVRNAGKFRTIVENITISEVLTFLKDRIASKTDTATLCLQTDDDSDLCL